jgi:hypothetical protein
LSGDSSDKSFEESVSAQGLGARDQVIFADRTFLDSVDNVIYYSFKNALDEDPMAYLKEIKVYQRNVELQENLCKEVLAKEGNQRNSIRHDFITAKIHLRDAREHSELDQNILENYESEYGAAYAIHVSLPEVIKELKRRAKQFKKLPIGPIASFVQLEENTPRSLKHAIEAQLESVLGLFICHCKDDAKIFSEVCDQCGVFPSYIIAPIGNSNSSPKKINKYYGKHAVLSDYLIITDSTVEKVLANWAHIDNIIVAQDYETAKKIMWADFPPNNVIGCLTFSALYLTTAPNRQEIILNIPENNCLQVPENVEEMRLKLQRSTIRYQDARIKYLDLIKSKSAIRNRIHQVEVRLDMLISRKLKLGREIDFLQEFHGVEDTSNPVSDEETDSGNDQFEADVKGNTQPIERPDTPDTWIVDTSDESDDDGQPKPVAQGIKESSGAKVDPNVGVIMDNLTELMMEPEFLHMADLQGRSGHGYETEVEVKNSSLPNIGVVVAVEPSAMTMDVRIFNKPDKEGPTQSKD